MVYLARIQMRLVLDLSVVYDLQLDPEDPEDVLMVFGYALGVAPTEMLGTAAMKAAGGGTQTLIKRYVSKNVLKAIQGFARKLGFKILQRTIVKYAVPAASAAVGGSYNYLSTRSVGKIAKIHFKNRRKFTGELHRLLSRQNTYELVFPAAALYIASLDGQVSPKERELYRSMLSRMRLEEYDQKEFQSLVDNKENLIEAAAKIEGVEMRHRLLDVLVLMAICDGALTEKEREFLNEVSETLEVPLDLAEAERKARDYRVATKSSIPQRMAGGIRDTATVARGKARGIFGKMLGRGSANKSDPEAGL